MGWSKAKFQGYLLIFFKGIQIHPNFALKVEMCLDASFPPPSPVPHPHPLLFLYSFLLLISLFIFSLATW
jgi:hypothetical protein